MKHRLSVIALVLTSAFAGVNPVMAAAPNDPATIRIPMTVVGFDPEVAAANGYPAVPPVSAFSTDVVTGNCGYSSVSLRDVGSKKYTVVTGFGVAPAAVSYTWSVGSQDPTGTRRIAGAGVLLFGQLGRAK